MIYDILEDWEENAHRLTELINELMNHRGDCRTATATPGLLTILMPCLILRILHTGDNEYLNVWADILKADFFVRSKL